MKILFAGDFSVQDRAIKLFDDRSKATHAFNGVEKAYGKIEVTDGNPSSEPNDGSKSILVE